MAKSFIDASVSTEKDDMVKQDGAALALAGAARILYDDTLSKRQLSVLINRVADKIQETYTQGARVVPEPYGLTDTTRLTASARVKLGSGRLVSITNVGANSATVTAYDAHGNSGRVIYTGTIATGSVVNLTDAWAVHGIYIALSGTSPSVDFLTTEI